MNNKGMALQVTMAIILIGGIIGTATVKTANDGTLQKNGKKIWCKMQNKGADFCDQTYQ